MPLPGLHTLSADPMVMVYNKALLPPAMRPRGLRQLAAIARAHPQKFPHRITTYDASIHALAYAVQWAAITAGRPGGWELMTKLAPFVRVESGGATMLDKVTVGEYLVGYHISAVTVLPKMRDKGRAEIVAWELCADGTPVVPRGIAITRAARSPASAALALEFMLDREGQIAAAQGGLTPYRRDVGERDVPYLTLDGIARRIGRQNLVMVGYDHRMVTENGAFIRRWDNTFKRLPG
jgi:iron(III) transport system substrate-binding protein